MDYRKLQLLTQVTLEDSLAELLYSPLLIASIATVLCYFDIIPFPFEILLSAVVVISLLLGLRMLRNWIFIGRSEPLLALVGKRNGGFRKWAEHTVHFDDKEHPETKYSFIKGEVSEGENLLVLRHLQKKNKILLVQRQRDKDSLLDL